MNLVLKTRKSRQKLPSNPNKISPAHEVQQDEYFDDETPLMNVLENLKKINVRKKKTNIKMKVHQKEKQNMEKSIRKSVPKLLKNH